MLLAEPPSVRLGPVSRLPAREDQPSPQQELGQAVPSSSQVHPRIVAATAQIANGLLVLGRSTHLGEQTGSQQLGELAGIPPIGLHPVSGTNRNQGGGHDDALQPASLEEALQRIPAWPRLIRAAHVARSLDSINQAVNRSRFVRQIPLYRLTIVPSVHRDHDPAPVDVHPTPVVPSLTAGSLRMRLYRPRRQPAAAVAHHHPVPPRICAGVTVRIGGRSCHTV
jgi:hypothetical protein